MLWFRCLRCRGWEKVFNSPRSAEICQIVNNSNAIGVFQERLKSFVVFHLGFDAKVLLRPDAKGWEVSVQHGRVNPFSFRLSGEELARLAEYPDQLEEFLLTQLTRHRRNR